MLSAWASNGTGSFGPPERLPLRAPAQDIVLADIDGDSDLDVIAATDLNTLGGEALAIHLNRTIEAPWTYCVAKMTSNGCLPALGWSGVPSASSGLPFLVTAS